MTVLDAWLYGEHVAVLRPSGSRIALEFTDRARSRWGDGAYVISGQLPLSSAKPSPAVVTAWLRGLLPEGRARLRLVERAGLDADNVLGFLAHYGRDTAGALVLVPEGEDPGQPDHRAEPLTTGQIEALLTEAAQAGAADQASSLAGLETKIVLTWTEAGWAAPAPRFPSTHIVKLARPANSLTADLIDTEVAALELARSIGISDVEARLETFGSARTIVVRRYDRVPAADAIERLHQEDTAQILGLNTDDPVRKFQYGGRTPALAAIANRFSGMGISAEQLLALTTFNLAIGNVDAHAKNISVLHLPDGRHRLAPVYDVAMHLHQGTGEDRFAMDLAGERDMRKLAATHLIAEARTWRMSQRQAVQVVTETVDALAGALQTIDRHKHSGVSDAAWRTVDERVARLQANLTREMRPARGRVGHPPSEQPRLPAGRRGGGRFASPKDLDGRLPDQ